MLFVPRARIDRIAKRALLWWLGCGRVSDRGTRSDHSFHSAIRSVNTAWTQSTVLEASLFSTLRTHLMSITTNLHSFSTTPSVNVHCKANLYYLPIAIAYSMGQIIKSFCVCACVRACVCVCPSVDTLPVAFLRRFSPNWTQTCKPTKVRTSSLGSISPHPFPHFPPKKPILGRE